MTDLLEACDQNGVISLAPALSIGERVEVVRGPLSNFVGRVHRLTADQRAIILLDIIGKQTRVAVNTADLRAASGRTKQSG
jgi:transcriptional antiterminator RfaH